jgi:TATA-binding protein-associated factor
MAFNCLYNLSSVSFVIDVFRVRLLSTDDKGTPTSRVASPGPDSNGPSTEKVIIDPSKGGAVSPKMAQQSKALDVKTGDWVWSGVVSVLEVDLFSAAWEVRHGAAMALREVIKTQGTYGGMRGWHFVLCSNSVSYALIDGASMEENLLAHERWCNDLAAKFLCVFVLDRFGDFVSDQVFPYHHGV